MTYTCDYCGDTFRTTWAASRCCDPISMDSPDDLDLDGTSIHRSQN